VSSALFIGLWSRGETSPIATVRVGEFGLEVSSPESSTEGGVDRGFDRLTADVLNAFRETFLGISGVESMLAVKEAVGVRSTLGFAIGEVGEGFLSESCCVAVFLRDRFFFGATG
jgi:hypothetical protein